jgi:hypothetical protein
MIQTSSIVQHTRDYTTAQAKFLEKREVVVRGTAQHKEPVEEERCPQTQNNQKEGELSTAAEVVEVL